MEATTLDGSGQQDPDDTCVKRLHAITLDTPRDFPDDPRMADRLDQDRGNRADYRLGTQLGWDAFEVVRWHGIEELSLPFEHEITLRRGTEMEPIDIDALVGTGATLRIATRQRWKAVHGIVAEVEELDRTRTFTYFRALLVPPIWRMSHRRRSRTFVERTFKEIVTTALEDRSYPGAPLGKGLLPLSGPDIAPPDVSPSWNEFVEPHGRFVWRVADMQRLEHADLHKFVVQYDESDLEFVSRLLEHEGLTYYFEHGRDAAVMVITDTPGQDPLHESDKHLTFRGGSVAGSHKDQEIVRWLRSAQRMRSRSVEVREYDYRRARNLWTSRVETERGADWALGDYVFRPKDERLEGKLGEHQARIRLERHEVERRLRQGMSTVRTLLPGHTLEIRDADALRDDEKVLIVRVETFATALSMEGSLLANEPFGFDGGEQELGAFENRFQALHAKAPFRPARATPRPKIWGVHTAKVWGPSALTIAKSDDHEVWRTGDYDVHCNDLGCIMLQLPWDMRETQDDKPPSDWIRVAQPWAGKSYGAQHVPRVGHEVLVAYEDGDPDRPVVVGSVYNPIDSPPPYNTQSALDKSRTTLKSRSTTVRDPADGFNEFRFTDLATEEEIYLHAQRNLNEVVEKDHSTTVGGNQSNSVGGNQSNSVHQNRTHDITGTENVHVHGDRTTNFDANESHKVGVNRSTEIGSVERLEVGSGRTVIVHGPDMAVVGTDDVTQIGGARTVQVAGSHDVQTGAGYHSSAGSKHVFDSPHFQVNAETLCLSVGGATLSMKAGNITLDNGAGASVTLSGGSVFVVGGTVVAMSTGEILLVGGNIDATAGNIHLNG